MSMCHITWFTNSFSCVLHVCVYYLQWLVHLEHSLLRLTLASAHHAPQDPTSQRRGKVSVYHVLDEVAQDRLLVLRRSYTPEWRPRQPTSSYVLPAWVETVSVFHVRDTAAQDGLPGHRSYQPKWKQSHCLPGHCGTGQPISSYILPAWVETKFLSRTGCHSQS